MLSSVCGHPSVCVAQRRVRMTNEWRTRHTSKVYFVNPKKDPASAPATDGIKILYDDHKHFRNMFSNYEKARTKSAKLEIVRQLVKDLSAHSSAEQRYVYPLISSKLAREDLQDRNYSDEKVNQIVLEWIDHHLPSTDQEWELYDDTVHKLKTQLVEHMKEEETMVFKPLSKLLPPEDQQQLYDNIIWAKEHGPTHPHPDSPQRPPASTVLHPVIGQVDQAVDSASGLDDVNTGDRA